MAAKSGSGDAGGKDAWSPPTEDTTREGHAEALRRLRDCAAGAGSWAAAVSAELQRGKLLGLNAGGETEAATVYGRMSPAERRALIGDFMRQWHRQGLVPADVCQSIVALELERGGLPMPGDDSGDLRKSVQERNLA